MGQTAAEAVTAATEDFKAARNDLQWVLTDPAAIVDPHSASQAVSKLCGGCLLLGEAVALKRAGDLQYAKSKAVAARDYFDTVLHHTFAAVGKRYR